MKIYLCLQDVDKFIQPELEQFITIESVYFFNNFKINMTFLDKDPSLKKNNENLNKGLKVVNNTDEKELS